jgi:hypothetical protein
MSDMYGLVILKIWVSRISSHAVVCSCLNFDPEMFWKSHLIVKGYSQPQIQTVMHAMLACSISYCLFMIAAAIKKNSVQL